MYSGVLLPSRIVGAAGVPGGDDVRCERVRMHPVDIQCAHPDHSADDTPSHVCHGDVQESVGRLLSLFDSNLQPW